LERIDTQEGIMVEALLNSGAIEIVISLEFAKKKRFKLKKLERPIYMRNVDGTFNRECYDLRSLGLDKRTTFVLEKHKRTR